MVVQVSFQFRNKCKAFQCFWWSQIFQLVTWILPFQHWMCLSLNVNREQRELLQETFVEVTSLQSPSCHFLFAYMKASFVPLRTKNICSKTVPYCKGVARRRWCGHKTVPHLQYFPSHNPRWKASMSFLLVGEVTNPKQQRYLILKQCATLKAHRHFQPFFISFQQACSSSLH